MISFYTKEFVTSLFEGYTNIVAFLINDSSLGLTDFPNPTQTANRRNLTMTSATSNEVALGNGYSRFVVTLDLDNLEYNSITRIFTVSPLNPPIFTASGGNIGPFTHICYAYNANLTGASSSLNGNNRGDSTGSLIDVEPVSTSAITLTPSLSFTHTKVFTHQFN